MPRHCTGDYTQDGTHWTCNDCHSVVKAKNSSISRHDRQHKPGSTYRRRQDPGLCVACGFEGTCTKEFVNFNSFYAHMRRDHGLVGSGLLQGIEEDWNRAQEQATREKEAEEAGEQA